MKSVVLFIAVALVGNAFSAGTFGTFNDTSQLFKDSKGKAKPQGGLDQGGMLSGKTLSIGNRTLTPLIPVSGQTVPSKAQYQNGKISVLGLTVEGKPGIDKRNYYQVQISGPQGPLPGYFLVPEDALNGLTVHNAASITNDAFNFFKIENYLKTPCDGGSKRPMEPRLTKEEEKKYLEDVKESRKRRRDTLIPESRFEHGTGDQSHSGNYGDAPFAGGLGSAVPGGSDLVLKREDDPNASNGTEGCSFLSEEQSEMAGEVEYTKEDYKRCINNIHKRILEGLAPLNNSKRKEFFGRLFELPNHEQELAASIFTLKGEMERGNLADGVMILKVLKNRRDNANRIEDKIKQCHSEFSDNDAERSACIGKANEDSVFNLLDIALHRAKVGGTRENPVLSNFGQFSMYNTGKAGNWADTLGSSSENHFDEQLDVFMAFADADIQGSGDIDVNDMYHYVNLNISSPGWMKYPNGKERPKRSVTVTLPDGTTQTTNKHTIYENVDGADDGFRVPVFHEFRKFGGD